MLNECDLAKYIEKAIQLRLAGYEILLEHTLDEIISCANGIGPASFPDWLREKIDRANPTLAPAAVIHDLRYEYGKGTRADFLQANADLEINGKLLADDAYGPCNPARYWVRFKAHEFRKACDKFGYSAYLKAINLHLAKTVEKAIPGAGKIVDPPIDDANG